MSKRSWAPAALVAAGMAALSGCTTMVAFKSSPPGAVVSYDGKEIGRTPFNYELWDRFGWGSVYEFTASAPGYDPETLYFREKTMADAQFIVPERVDFVLDAIPGAKVAEQEPVAPPPVALATPAPAAAIAPPAPAAPAPVDHRADVQAAVQSWAAAWSQRDLATYVAAYDPAFTGRHATRRAWLDERRARIAPRKAISVDVSDVQVATSGDIAQASFVQAYASGALKDTTRKTLELRRDAGGRWLIDRETTVQ